MNFIIDMLKEKKDIHDLKRELYLKGEKIEKFEKLFDETDNIFSLHERMMVGWGAYDR